MAVNLEAIDSIRKYFKRTGEDIFEMIETAIMVASSERTQEFLTRRDQIAEKLFTMPREVGFKKCSFNGDNDGAITWKSITNSGTSDSYHASLKEEEENRLVKEVLRIKTILANPQAESDDVVFDSLRRLQLMSLSIQIMKATEIGKAVNALRKHGTEQISDLVRTLISGWRNEYINADLFPGCVKPTLMNEENLHCSHGSGASMAAQTTKKTEENFLHGKNEDPKALRRHIVRIKVGAQCNKGKQLKMEEAVLKQTNPPDTPDSVPAKPPKQSSDSIINNETKGQEHEVVGGQQNNSRLLDEESLQIKFQASTRKLQQRYQQAQNAKRKIGLIKLRDLPQQKFACSNTSTKFGKRVMLHPLDESARRSSIRFLGTKGTKNFH